MVKSLIFLEGGGNVTELRARCRNAFTSLFSKCGLEGKLPRFVACGSRQDAFKRFKTALSDGNDYNFLAMLIDSEDPVEEIELTWKHLKTRDNWAQPRGAIDDQVLFMTTCMETWIIADLSTLATYYGSNFNKKLIPTTNLESRNRHEVFGDLVNVSDGKYSKGKQSFEVLSKINPDAIEPHLPSFQRVRKILNQYLK